MRIRPNFAGFYAKRPTQNGQMIFVKPLGAHRARIAIGKLGSIERSWDYESPEAALKAFNAWDASRSAEPKGWISSSDDITLA